MGFLQRKFRNKKVRGKGEFTNWETKGCDLPLRGGGAQIGMLSESEALPGFKARAKKAALAAVLTDRLLRFLESTSPRVEKTLSTSAEEAAQFINCSARLAISMGKFPPRHQIEGSIRSQCRNVPNPPKGPILAIYAANWMAHFGPPTSAIRSLAMMTWSSFKLIPRNLGEKNVCELREKKSAKPWIK